MTYKRHLNPKCNRLFQRPSRAENSVQWYANAPLGHNYLGKMMSTISEQAGLSKRYTNHSLRSTTVHILDSNDFAGRHITSVTGHRSETLLKTYTGYTAPCIKRKMLDTIYETLRSKLQKKPKYETVTVEQNRPESDDENDINLANSDLVPLSDSQFDNMLMN